MQYTSVLEGNTVNSAIYEVNLAERQVGTVVQAFYASGQDADLRLDAQLTVLDYGERIRLYKEALLEFALGLVREDHATAGSALPQADVERLARHQRQFEAMNAALR